MRILYVLNTNEPFHLYRGGGQRSFLIYKALQELGHVDVAAIYNPDLPFTDNEDLESNLYKISLRSFSTNNFGRLYSKSLKLINFLLGEKNFYSKNTYLENKLDSIIRNNKYDIIFSRYLETAILSNVLKYHNLIVDIDDLPHDQFLIKEIKLLPKFLRKKIYNNIKTQYDYLITKIPISFVSNPNQKQVSNQRILKNIPLINESENSNSRISNIHYKKDGNNLLYIGSLDYEANYKSILYFIKHVWPIVINKSPNLKFNIIGKGLPQYIQEEIKKIDGINYIGYVKDLNPYFASSSIYISPVYYGTGTNIKILEAISKDIPIVASPMVLRGYEHFLKDGENILIGKDDQEFANKILTLVKDQILQNKMINQAKNDLKNEGYDFNHFKKTVQNSCFEIMGSNIKL